MSRYVITIGLEIHAELLTSTKVFCSCSAEFGGEPNSRCCPVCCGMPGTLPVLNKKAVEYIIKAGYAMNCDISRFTKWDRKNYFYPDLPKAYQISQLPRPVCQGGYIDITAGGEQRRIRLDRIHLEEDAGKLVHDEERGVSLADYNRCGIPLIEIVTMPDFHSTDEADIARQVTEFFTQVKLLLQYAEICDCRMEQGSIRCDVNISLAHEGSGSLGTRTELKNLNSMRTMARAVAAEAARQRDILERGGAVIQETRRFDDRTGSTVPLRSKEEAQDYRYFPEPDIPPLMFTEEELSEIRGSLPELPQQRINRYTARGVSPSDAAVIVGNKRISDLFDEVLENSSRPDKAAGLLVGEFMRRVNLGEIDADDIRFSGKAFAELVELLYSDKLSQANARLVLGIMAQQGGSPAEIAEQNDLWIKEDSEQLSKVVGELIAANPRAAEQFRSGDKKVLGFFMGQANKALKGAASPKSIQECIIRMLSE